MFFTLNGHTHFLNVSDIIIIPCLMNFIISTPFLSRETVVISVLADNICLNSFGLLGECVCSHYIDGSLVSMFPNETRVSSPVTRMM
jgi:hypothetical protein